MIFFVSKLVKCGLGDHTVSCLEVCTQTVFTYGSTSNWREVLSGVLHGIILAPVFVNMLINLSTG